MLLFTLTLFSEIVSLLQHKKLVLCCFFTSQCVNSLKSIAPGSSTTKKLPFIGLETVRSGLQRSPGVLLTVLIKMYSSHGKQKIVVR